MESELNDNQIKIHRNYEFRLYPNDEQIDLLNNHFFTSNQAWNFYLDSRINDLEKNKDLPKANRIYKKFNDVSLDVKNTIQSRNLKFNSGSVQYEMRKLDTIKLTKDFLESPIALKIKNAENSARRKIKK